MARETAHAPLAPIKVSNECEMPESPGVSTGESPHREAWSAPGRRPRLLVGWVEKREKGLGASQRHLPEQRLGMESCVCP